MGASRVENDEMEDAKSAFDGTWKQGATTLTIASGKLHAEGFTSFVVVGAAKCELAQNGQVYTGILQLPGKIQWNDGDVWKKEEVSKPHGVLVANAGSKAHRRPHSVPRASLVSHAKVRRKPHGVPRASLVSRVASRFLRGCRLEPRADACGRHEPSTHPNSKFQKALDRVLRSQARLAEGKSSARRAITKLRA